MKYLEYMIFNVDEILIEVDEKGIIKHKTIKT